jgi:hypothetical protein
MVSALLGNVLEDIHGDRYVEGSVGQRKRRIRLDYCDRWIVKIVYISTGNLKSRSKKAGRQ